MGDLIDFSLWKNKREIEDHEREILEVISLREELSNYLDEISDTMIKDEAQSGRARKIIQTMIKTLESKNRWPIDSSDM